MNTEKLIAVVSILVILSIASERLVEIIKAYIPSLVEDKVAGDTIVNPQQELQKEARRKAKISVLAIAAGIFTAFLASPILAGIFKDLFPGSTCPFAAGFFNFGTDGSCGFNFSIEGLPAVLALGLLASGGSSLWNSVLEYLLKIKDLKKIKIENEKVETEKNRVQLKLLNAKHLRLQNTGKASDIPFSGEAN